MRTFPSGAGSERHKGVPSLADLLTVSLPVESQDFACHKGRVYGLLYRWECASFRYIGIPQVSIGSNSDKYFRLIFRFSPLITLA